MIPVNDPKNNSVNLECNSSATKSPQYYLPDLRGKQLKIDNWNWCLSVLVAELIKKYEKTWIK